MTVKELIKFLEGINQDVIVKVVVHDSKGSYYEQGGTCSTEVFDPVKHFEYSDLRGCEWAKGKPYENEISILLGEM